MRIRNLAFLSLAYAGTLCAQSVEDYRGGWILDEDGYRHIYYLVFRGGKISGTYCYDCEDPYKLAFIDDGVLSDDGLQFSIYHYPRGGEPYTQQVSAALVDDELELVLSGPGNLSTTRVAHRTRPEDIVRLPMPDSSPNNQVGPGLTGRVRILPGDAEIVSVEKVVGLWLWGTGPGKQHFIFRRHKDGVRGMVCGPCNSAPDVAPLESIRLDDTNFHFEIVHEDNGLAIDEHGPHSNVTDAEISRHEMHMSVTPSFEGPDFSPIEMTLLGPILTD